MASPYVFKQASTPASSKRKASEAEDITPPRRPLPPGNQKPTALERCYEGEVAETRMQQWVTGGAEDHMTQHYDNEHAGQRLSGGLRDPSMPPGEEKLSLSEILPISDELGNLFHNKVNLDTSNAVNAERDELRRERDDLAERIKVARQDQNLFRRERDSYLIQRNFMKHERDRLLQEQRHHHQELETLKGERDKFRNEKELLHKQVLEEKSARKSTENGMVSRTVLNNAEKERDELGVQSARHREEREQVRQESRSIRRELEETRSELNSFKNANAILDVESGKLRRALDNEKKLRESSTANEIKKETIKLTLCQVEERLTESQNSNATLKAESDRLHMQLSVREKALLKLCTENNTNKLTLRQVEKRLIESQDSNTTLKAGSDQLLMKLHSLEEDLGKLSADNESKKLTLRNVHEQLGGSQTENAALKAESDRLRVELRDKEAELQQKSTDNEANLLTLRQVQAAHAVCEHDQRLQLGRINRQAFFDDFSKFAETLSGKVFKGREGSQDVDVCFCVLPGSNEAICVIRKLGCAYTIWHSKMEDCTTFSYAWHRWLRLGGEHQGKPIYISLDANRETNDWLRRTLAIGTVSTTEEATLNQTRQLS